MLDDCKRNFSETSAVAAHSTVDVSIWAADASLLPLASAIPFDCRGVRVDRARPAIWFGAIDAQRLAPQGAGKMEDAAVGGNRQKRVGQPRFDNGQIPFLVRRVSRRQRAYFIRASFFHSNQPDGNVSLGKILTEPHDQIDQEVTNFVFCADVDADPFSKRWGIGTIGQIYG